MDIRSELQILSNWPEAPEPLLSVVCLAYNQVNYIGRTLDSFLEQVTDFRFEVLVNDDASTDGTAEVIADYAARYPHIIKPIFHKENQYSKGLSHGLPVFRKARGRYIAYCEGDDFWTDPRKLQIQVDFLERNPDYVITYHDAYTFNEDGVLKPQQLTGKFRRDASRLELQQARPISTLTTCFRNVLTEMPAELLTTRMVDLCWWSLLGAYGKGKFLGEIRPAAYRVHKGGIFSMQADRVQQQMTLHTYYCLARYYQRIGDRALNEYFLVQVCRLSMASIPLPRKIEAFLLLVGNHGMNLLKRLNPIQAR
ncbi:glycosyltransferase family 2 protein [Pseudomonas sp. ZM23]|uniref:Glycosyltransferase family 2 protein n=1 Tax=Pseudomonas triclosanedens TaxID=2961893 RepID=A0ABY6ZWR9_9PSED|nr:glycosyltransferase family 2 protein [Pseudomonas triclosanedens]MCP8466864.1 glycosyltransferase family 2 protein [Pseudomonas triclosanedens]MCP8470088.1 glycosyltransferase family 2 protein [Pseudomonas triclosanedens]MCP8477998.1 glycosyltransferase family 2 protein [Pseudomonas triclosanedens]WAI49412.1 glycosyltransferase family 2 protein [Pseudomonas triclosanedens]